MARQRQQATRAITFSIQKGLRARLDGEVARLKAAHPDRLITRSAVIGFVLDEGLPETVRPRKRRRAA